MYITLVNTIPLAFRGHKREFLNSMHEESFGSQLKEDLAPVIRHGISMCVAVLCIWAFHALLAATIGEEARLFDSIPIRYLAHAGDLIVFTRFIWKALREFK
jgi:hypothetical protein